ncbi:MAG: ATP synthase F1 subunit gamma [Chthoniobacterales bacterium]
MAANTRDIRRRIKSVKNTAQITKAMQMVAASKMRRAQQQALAARPYANLLNKVLVSVEDRVDHALHPLLEVRDVKKELVILISTDKGLCGGLNTNLFREVAGLDQEKTEFVASGRKGVQFLARSGRNLLADFQLADSPTFLDSKAMSKFAMEKFLSGEVDRVRVAYTHFVNTLTLVASVRTVLPISPFDLPGADKNVTEATAPATEEIAGGYLFEPSAHDVLDAILPYYVHFQIYQMVLDSRASEHSARMVAMKSATDNAKQLVKDLTLEYNKVRQASITTEILEIASAAAAME